MGINKKLKLKIHKMAEEAKVSNIVTAIKTVIKKSMAADGVCKGLNEVGKSLDRKDCFVVVLAKDCEDPKYKKLITALAKQNKIPLIEIDKRQELGEWLGQCKYDKTGVAKKIRGCSSAPSRTTVRDPRPLPSLRTTSRATTAD